MSAIDAAVADSKSSPSTPLAEIARRHNVNRSTLSRRVNQKATSSARFHEMRRLLNPKKEKHLVKFIRRLCERSLPPTSAIVNNVAAELAGRTPSKNWVSRFVERNRHVLDSRYLDSIDFARAKADSKASYEAYFNTVSRIIEEYSITAENIYNMDEKGFLVGNLQKTRRIFTKDLWEQGGLLGSIQDGNREWITVIATICADGTALSPGLIYKAVSEGIRSVWVEDCQLEEDACFFTSSPNGWTSNELGASWLLNIFHKETANKAKRAWRLLFVDGHGSHLNENFWNICETHRIQLIIYPPHSTHRLQPLDVGMFAPLAAFYSQGLDSLIRITEGYCSITKRDFFSIFWTAFERAFTEKNIASAWAKVGLWPFEPSRVLSMFNRQSTPLVRSSNSPSEEFDSPSKGRLLRRTVNSIYTHTDAAGHKKVEELATITETSIVRWQLERIETRRLTTALNHVSKRKPRKKNPAEKIRAEQGTGTLWFGPSQLRQAQEEAIRQREEKEQKQRDRVLYKQEQAQKKLRDQAEKQAQRDARVVATAARKAAVAEKKAAAAAAREAKRVAKHLQLIAKTSSRVLKTRPKQQGVKRRRPTSIVEQQVTGVVEPRKTRGGRIVKQPARLKR